MWGKWRGNFGEVGQVRRETPRHKFLIQERLYNRSLPLFPPSLTHLYHGQPPPLEILRHYTTSRIYTKIEKNKTKQKMCVKCVNKLFSSDVLQISLDTGSCVNYIQYVRLISYKM